MGNLLISLNLVHAKLIIVRLRYIMYCNVHVRTVSLASVTVEIVLGVATVELEAVIEEGVAVERLVDEPLVRRRVLLSVPSP